MIDSSEVLGLSDEIKARVAQSYLHSFWVVPGEFLSTVFLVREDFTNYHTALVIGAQLLALFPMVLATEEHAN